jgi:hypothetical protein
VPWSELVEPTFLVGLLLLLPFAAAGYLAARALLRASDAVRRLIARRPPARHPEPPTVVAWPRPTESDRGKPRRTVHAGRGPPAAHPASG